MKHVKLIMGLLLTSMIGFTACDNEELSSQLPAEEICGNGPNYTLTYTDQQLINWEQTGSPFLEDEQMNSSTTFIDPTLTSQAGTFTPIPDETQTRAWGVHPYQNRFWSMIRLIIAVPEPLRSMVVDAIDEIEEKTNIRFYNSIEDKKIDPIYGIELPNVHISGIYNNQQGSSFIGLKGGEQHIYLPSNADVAYIVRALVNVAGMYNEYQRNDRDTYVNVYTSNAHANNRYHFNKITSNYYGIGSFDWNSITLNGSYAYSQSGSKTLTKKAPSGADLPVNTQLSPNDRSFLNYFYLPYIARSDVYRELDRRVYKSDNTLYSESERLELERYLNNGMPNPGASGKIIPVPW